MKEVLKLLENDCRLTPKQIGAMLGKGENEIQDIITQCETNKIILGYKTLIDWDRVSEELVSALIEVKIAPQRGYGFDRIAERIYQFDEVESLYLMSGSFDLAVFLTGTNVKAVSQFVFGKLAPIEGVTSTSTHIILKKYKEKGCIFSSQQEQEERLLFV